MKLFSTEQIKEIDHYTIEHEGITSLDLMERAALACVARISKLVSSEEEVRVFCGKGNNGGDGLAITRLLRERGFNATAFVINYTETFSPDAETNYQVLKKKFPEALSDLNNSSELLSLPKNTNCVVLDALLGTGLSKPVEGFLGEVISFLNNSPCRIISIDMPSGLYVDKCSVKNTSIIRSSLCLSFQFPKLSFLLPENGLYVPEFEILDIGLSEKKIQETSSNYYYLTKKDIAYLLKKRAKFSHKGTYGHALLLAGSKGKSGAALIASKACLRSGAGLLTLQSTKDTITALHSYLPEAMSREDAHDDYLSELKDPQDVDAICFGPGVGTQEDTQNVLKKLLQYYHGKLVLDADGLTILSENKTWLTFLPPAAILTPHPKEFERLTEKATDDYEKLQILKQFSLKFNCIVILKGAHTCIAMPDGNLFFNSSGNAGLAKGGSGDGLSGILLGLLTRGYSAPQVALIGTFVHGYAADLCAKEYSLESILISDVIEQIPMAFKDLEMQQVSHWTRL
ncbi:MAG: NAD(P)H-hydrate dehydratase [bacterium]|nr:NAD(P)H-hydrate dehydratase [bacterium]